MKKTVLLADDHAIVRKGLRALIETNPDLVVVGEVEDGKEAVNFCRKYVPDLVILDVTMPKLNGIDAIGIIMEKSPETKILAFSMHAKKHIVQKIIAAGASGYLLKSCASDEINEAIDKILAGGIYISPKLSTVFFDDYVDDLNYRKVSEVKLSPREYEVLQSLSDGKSTKIIASDLNLSPRTVEMHRSNVMKKLKFDSIVDLVKYAVKEGLTSLD